MLFCNVQIYARNDRNPKPCSTKVLYRSNDSGSGGPAAEVSQILQMEYTGSTSWDVIIEKDKQCD